MLTNTINTLNGADIDAATVLAHIETLSALTLDLNGDLGGHDDASESTSKDAQATRLFLPNGEAINLRVRVLPAQQLHLSDEGQLLRLLEAWLLPWQAWPEAARVAFDAHSRRLGVVREGSALTLTGPLPQRPRVATQLAFACCRLSDLVLDASATGFASVGLLVPQLLGHAQLEAQALAPELEEVTCKGARLWRSRADTQHWVLGLGAEYGMRTQGLALTIEACCAALAHLGGAGMRLTCVVDDRRLEVAVPSDARLPSAAPVPEGASVSPVPQVLGLRALLANA